MKFLADENFDNRILRGLLRLNVASPARLPAR